MLERVSSGRVKVFIGGPEALERCVFLRLVSVSDGLKGEERGGSELVLSLKSLTRLAHLARA